MTASVVAFVTALAPIAREVGVTLPPPQAWSDRLAAIDDIDLDALTADARRLRSVTDQVVEVAAGIGDLADGLPAAWHGVAGHRAHSAVADVHRSCDEAGHRLRSAAEATSAAARGVADLRSALHTTLAAVPGLVLAGRAIAELTGLDLETNRAVVAAMLEATVATVETAMTVTESAITEVLTVLADTTGRLADPPQSTSTRTDVGLRPRPTVDVTGVVGALAGAGAAAAGAVGMAAVGAAGVVAHVVDTALDTQAPEPASPVSPPPVSPPVEHVPQRPDRVAQDQTPVPEATTNRGAPAAGGRPQLNLRYDDEPAAPSVVENVPAPEPPPVERTGPPEPSAPPRVEPAAPGTSPEQHEAPAAVTRSGPAASPDPDDGGGLALAGDR
ncbi:MAG: hypothetical protein PGN29_14115 [Gordonia paraffinivorans]